MKHKDEFRQSDRKIINGHIIEFINMNLSLISTRKSATQHAINDTAKAQEKTGEVQNYIYQFILSLHLRSIFTSKIFHQHVSIPHIQRLIQLNLTRTDEKRVHYPITI